MPDKTIIGLTEKVTLFSPKGKKQYLARIDTGATKSSLDAVLVAQLELGPIVSSRMVKSAHGNRLRPVIEAEIEIAGKRIKEKFTLAERDHMNYKILIGQNILIKGFLIDPSKP